MVTPLALTSAFPNTAAVYMVHRERRGIAGLLLC